MAASNLYQFRQHVAGIKVNGEFTEQTVKYAMQAAKYDGVDVDPVTARKLKLLKLALSLPAADRPGAADELAKLSTKLDSVYSTGKFTYNAKTYTLNDASEVMAKSRNPAELRAMFEGWRTVSCGHEGRLHQAD